MGLTEGAALTADQVAAVLDAIIAARLAEVAAALAELGFSPAEREVELAVHNEMLETAAAAAVRDILRERTRT